MNTLTGIFISIIISISNAQYTYRALAPQKYFNYFVNPYVSADFKGGNRDEGSVSLKFHKNIEKEDNFQVSVEHIDENGDRVSEIVKVVNLCDQLDKEMSGSYSLGIGDVFGLAGAECPILIGDVRETTNTKSFKWPTRHDFPEKINCGVHSYHATLYKCNRQGNNCRKLLEAGVESVMTSEHCNEDNVVEEDKAKGDTITEDNLNEDEKPVPVDLSSDIKVSKISESKLTDTNFENVEIVDTDPLNGQVTNTMIGEVDAVDATVDQVQLVNEVTGDNYDILNTEVNKISVINTDNVQQTDFKDYDDDENSINDDSYSMSEAPSVRVSQVKTKGNGMTHLEEIETEIGESGILESEVERDQTVDSESDNVEIETYNGGQGSRIIDNSGQIVKQDRVKANTVMHDLQ